MKKAQSAMEFLMTYGWAILVVLIIVGALGYFGVLNPRRLIPNSCQMTGKVKCDEIGWNDDAVSLHLTNMDMSLVKVIELAFVKEGGEVDTCSQVNTTATALADVDSNSQDPAGATVSFLCDGGGFKVGTAAAGSGDLIHGRLTIKYLIADKGDFPGSSTGNIHLQIP